jgi:uncharacterized Zn-binding protein involved in type VI secretion
MAARWSTILVLAFLAGCGSSGGGGASAPATNSPAPTQQSAGGLWFAVTTGSNNATSLMIAETGELRVTSAPTGSSGPGFGHGAVTVTGNRVDGSYKTRVFGPPTAPAGTTIDCTLSGTVSTRSSMQLTTTCLDAAGTSSTTALSFMYDARYDADSSLAEIAGNYTLTVNSTTNTLNINGDGTLFGMYHNGPRCTMNGTVSIIDSNFNLYRFELQFSNCGLFPSQVEGARIIGLATRNIPGQKTGAFLLQMTTSTDGPFQFFASVLYEPV